MRSRSKRGSTSAIYSPVNEACVTLARSEPEPLTHRIRVDRPRKSISSALAEVLPPPQLQIERSAPSLHERATNCASTVDVETDVIISNPFFVKMKLLLGTGIAATDGTGYPLPRHTLGVATSQESRNGVGITPLTDTSLS